MKYTRLFLSLLLLLALGACGEGDYTPKPKGYFRITLPEHQYQPFDAQCPYRFQYAKTAQMETDREQGENNCWYNLHYPGLNAMVHLTYYPVRGNFAQMTEDARTMAYKHSVKADAIDQDLFANAKNKVYGIMYQIEGNAASPLQFYVSDSTRHFLRGALYFNCQPNKDSLAPVSRYLKEDVVHLIESLQWDPTIN